jgi:cephalosporin hydroxylase
MLGPYSLLFVDADHTYKGVCSDLTLYPPLVDEGGIVAIHDVREGYPGVLRAVGELHEDVKLINPCLLGIAYYQQALQ